MSSSSLPTLEVDFVGELRKLEPGDELVFGREADLVIDENPYLHRRLGLLHSRGGVWWLRNLGERISLEVRDGESRSALVVAPGREVALSFAVSMIRFEAGAARYELSARQSEPTWDGTSDESHGDADDGATIGLHDLPLTDDQKRVLLVLCEGPLRDPSVDIEIPPSRQGAQRLGWTLKAYGRKLDNVCDRLDRLGVRGLHGDQAGVASDRRRALAEYALDARLVTAADLWLLDSV